MADLIIQNPSITPNVFEYDEAGRVSAISGYPLAGGGGGTIVKSDLMWKPNVGSDGYVRWTLASSATTPDEAYISGAQGPAGPQGVSGNPGKNPEFQINSENAHWEWRYSGDTGWTDLGVVASGAVGPQGLSGNNGKDGISPTVTTATIDGGNRVTFTYGEGSSTYIDVMSGASGANGINGISPTVSTETITGGNKVTFTYDDGGTTKTESIDVMSGASGANGSDGFSPTVELTPIQDSQYPQGGWNVKITDAEHQAGQTFQVFNGIDGQGATVDLIGGTGIQVSHQAGTTDYTISVSADYAMKSYVDSASANALSEAKTWVGNQHYLTSVPDTYALKSDVPTTVAQLTDSGNYYKKTETSGATEIANALSTKLDSTAAAQTYQTKSDMTNYLTTSDASTTYQPKGNYASASDIVGMATQTWVGQQGFITKNVNDLTYYYKKTETSGASELSTEFAKYVTKPDSSLVNKYLVLRTDNAGNVSGWCDFQDQSYSKSEANGTFVATANIDTTTLSGDGKSVSTKLGVKTDVIATKDYVNNSFLPLSGGTVSGKTTVSVSDFYALEVKRGDQATSTGTIGINGAGGMSFKIAGVNSNNTQLNISPTGTLDKRFSIGDAPHQPVAYLIPAVTATTTDGLTDDGILHIILES